MLSRFFMKLSGLMIVLAINVKALDQFFAIRAGFGVDGFTGKDTKPSLSGGFAWNANALGAQPISDGKNYWGVEAGFVQQRMGSDTVIWNNATGRYDDSVTMGLRFDRLELAFFAGRHFDHDIFVLAGPQISYLVSCSKNYAGRDEVCDDEYSPFQAEVQARVLFFIVEPLAMDLKYVQGFLPADAHGKQKTYAYTASLGFLYLF